MNKSKSYAPAGCLLTVFSLLFLTIGVSEGMVAQGVELYQLKQSGVTTSGVIIAQRVEESASGKISYHIVYRFNAETNGSIQQITHEERVSEDIYESLHQNDSISVVYLPDALDVRTIQDVNSSLKSVVTWAAVMLGCLCLGSLSMLQHGLGPSMTYLGTSLIVMGIVTFVGSFFGRGANTGRSRAICLLGIVLGMAILAVGVVYTAIKGQKKKPATTGMKHHQNDTYATNPLHLELSTRKLNILLPELTGYRGVLRKISCLWSGKSDLLAVLKEHIYFGDSQPAIVISTDPFLVAAYSKDIDCVAILRFPVQFGSKYGLQIRSKLVTINTYMRKKEYQSDLIPGPNGDSAWTGFHPVIADFVSDDIEEIESRKRSIDPTLWDYVYNLGVEYTQVHPGIWRDGRPFFSSKAGTV